MEGDVEGWYRRLEESQWLCMVGVPDGSPSTYWALTWAEATEQMEGEWDSAVQRGINALRLQLIGASEVEFRTWEAIAPDLERRAGELVSRKLPLPIPAAPPTYLRDAISLYLTYGLLEQHYVPLIQPGFFTALMDWVCRGHVPCGWQGEFPSGELIVF